MFGLPKHISCCLPSLEGLLKKENSMILLRFVFLQIVHPFFLPDSSSAWSCNLRSPIQTSLATPPRSHPLPAWHTTVDFHHFLMCGRGGPAVLDQLRLTFMLFGEATTWCLDIEKNDFSQECCHLPKNRILILSCSCLFLLSFCWGSKTPLFPILEESPEKNPQVSKAKVKNHISSRREKHQSLLA